MIKKFLGILGFVALSWSGVMANQYNDALAIKIEKVDLAQKTVTFPAYDLKVGETGFILTKLTDYDVISVKLQVVSIDDGVALAKFDVFDKMKQKYLPTPRVEPKADDMAIFRELNNRAFLIAPDSTTYEKIKSQIKDITFMNSDLLMGYLNQYGGYDPKPKFLKKVCQVYSVGLLYIVGTNSLNILDCQSLVSLDSTPFDTSKVSKPTSPFFSRLEEVKTGSLISVFYSKKSKDYFKYYDSLVQEGSKSK